MLVGCWARVEQTERDAIHEQRGRRAVAVVQFVAPRQRFGDDVAQVESTERPDGAVQDGPHAVPEPTQPVEHCRVVGTEDQRAAEALHEELRRAVAVRPVLDDHHRHAGRDRTHAARENAVVLGRAELDLAGGGLRDGLLGRLGEPFEERGADHPAPQQIAHLAPRDGRRSVQDHVPP